MRDIRCRGKSIYTDEWITGYYIGTGTLCKYGDEHWSVDDETVGQFTGLLDENNERIFEGDIVLYRGKSVGVVDFADGAFGVRFGDGTSAMFLCFAAEHSVVIGNIYDD